MTDDDQPRRPPSMSFVHYEPAIGRVVEDVPLPGDEDTVDVFRRNSFSMLISREMALDFGLAEPTPEEVERRAAERDEWRRREAEARAHPARPLSVEALLEALDWSAEYAQHWLHPACHCQPFDDDMALCSWAIELGFTISDDRRIE